MSTRIDLDAGVDGLLQASCTLGLVGVITIAFTPWVIIDSMASISPSSSVPLEPWAKIDLDVGVILVPVLAASTMVS